MFLVLEEDKVLILRLFVLEFIYIIVLKIFYCFDLIGFFEGGVYFFIVELLCKFLGLIEVYFGFGKIFNSWCYGF